MISLLQEYDRPSAVVSLNPPPAAAIALTSVSVSIFTPLELHRRTSVSTTSEAWCDSGYARSPRSTTDGIP